MNVRELELPGVWLLEPTVHRDDRGYLFESFRAELAETLGFPRFVQENQTFSVRDTLRGLHYQLDRPQAKLVRVLSGAIFDVAVDVRRDSPTFGKWVGHDLSSENRCQLFVPVGFAHGFCVTSDTAEVLYKCSGYYSGVADQRGVLWNDPGVAIAWPTTGPRVSAKDLTLRHLSRDRDDLPVLP